MTLQQTAAVSFHFSAVLHGKSIWLQKKSSSLRVVVSNLEFEADLFLWDIVKSNLTSVEDKHWTQWALKYKNLFDEARHKK